MQSENDMEEIPYHAIKGRLLSKLKYTSVREVNIENFFKNIQGPARHEDQANSNMYSSQRGHTPYPHQLIRRKNRDAIEK